MLVIMYIKGYKKMSTEVYCDWFMLHYVVSKV